MGINRTQTYLFDTFKFLTSQTSIAPLVVFRIIFGLMMFVSTLRFWSNGWIDALYVKPIHFFKHEDDNKDTLEVLKRKTMCSDLFSDMSHLRWMPKMKEIVDNSIVIFKHIVLN
mgnify:CR=1 FL=1